MRCDVQKIRNDEKAWDALIAHAGSPREILCMKDSASGPPRASLGAEAGHFLPYHVFDFWINIALCHALLVDTSDGETVVYQVRCSGPESPRRRSSRALSEGLVCHAAGPVARRGGTGGVRADDGL